MTDILRDFDPERALDAAVAQLGDRQVTFCRQSRTPFVFMTREQALEALREGHIVTASARWNTSFYPTIPIVPPSRIADLLCCGFEGGVGYWLEIVERRPPAEPVSAWGDENVYPHIDYPLTGGAVVCRDLDEPERDLVLDGAAVERGLQLLFEKFPYRHWASFTAENEDAETGDVFIQLCLLGEVIYG